MKKILLASVAALLLFSCQPKTDKPAADKPATEQTEKKATKADISYAFGLLIGADLKTTNVDFDLAAFQRGMKESISGKKTKITLVEASGEVQKALATARAKKTEVNLEAEKKFFEKNKEKTGVKATESGLQYEVLTEGTGPKPLATDTVKVNYVGTLLDGKEFDSSIKRNEPAVFPLNGVIPGWTEGIQLMTVGSKYKFYIPSTLAYGAQGAGNVIEPNATLVFEVELLSIETPAK